MPQSIKVSFISLHPASNLPNKVFRVLDALQHHVGLVGAPHDPRDHGSTLLRGSIAPHRHFHERLPVVVIGKTVGDGVVLVLQFLGVADQVGVAGLGTGAVHHQIGAVRTHDGDHASITLLGRCKWIVLLRDEPLRRILILLRKVLAMNR